MGKARVGQGAVVTTEWRRWIAERLLFGKGPQEICDHLVARGISLKEAQREVHTARTSPYLQVSQNLHSRVTQQAWVLDSQRRLNRMRDQVVPRRHRLSSEEFFREHYSVGRPVIVTGMMEDWPALSKWNVDYFLANFSNRLVEVQGRRDSDPTYEIHKEEHREKMRFGDYVEWVRAVGQSNDRYMTAYTGGLNRTALAELWFDLGPLAEYLRSGSGAHGNLWFGAGGTITPFHYDNANNMMAQVMGTKRILLIPASDGAQMYSGHRYFTEVDGRKLDYDRFPFMRDVTVSTVELAAGEILFVPVGWWHFVETLTTSAMVNFTNFLWPNDFPE
jgi:hypothetical protein